MYRVRKKGRGGNNGGGGGVIGVSKGLSRGEVALFGLREVSFQGCFKGGQ